MIEAGARVNTISPTEHAKSGEQAKLDRMQKEDTVLSTSF